MQEVNAGHDGTEGVTITSTPRFVPRPQAQGGRTVPNFLSSRYAPGGWRSRVDTALVPWQPGGSSGGRGSGGGKKAKKNKRRRARAGLSARQRRLRARYRNFIMVSGRDHHGFWCWQRCAAASPPSLTCL